MTSDTVYDLAVIGGGPAGSASAYHAAESGLKTILLEKEKYPRDKPCGGGLGARCVPLLGRHAIDAINCDLDEMRLYAPSYKRFACKGLPGHLVLRKEFDAAMAEDAKDAGAEVMDQCRVKEVTELPSGDYEIVANGYSFRAKYVIHATGFPRKGMVHSSVKREKYEADYMAMTVVSETAIDNKVLEPTGFSDKILALFFGPVPNGYGWCFVKDGSVNIGIGAGGHLLKDPKPMEAYHNFVKQLKQHGCLPPDLALAKATVFPLPFKRTARETVFGKQLMVGDFAGFVSPMTGEGLYYAIRGGYLAARAVKENMENGTPLTSYQDQWMKEFGRELNRYAYFLREMVYKSRARMELAVTLGRKDPKMADILNSMVTGTISYPKALRKALLRLPVSLIKAWF